MARQIPAPRSETKVAKAGHWPISPRSSPVIQAESWPQKSDAWKGRPPIKREFLPGIAGVPNHVR
jgi:hypothetical protein